MGQDLLVVNQASFPRSPFYKDGGGKEGRVTETVEETKKKRGKRNQKTWKKNAK